MGRVVHSYPNRIVQRDHSGWAHSAFPASVAEWFGARIHVAPLVTLVDSDRSGRFDSAGGLVGVCAPRFVRSIH